MPENNTPNEMDVIETPEQTNTATGPTKEQIDKWKQQYGVLEMQYIGGEPYVYRQLTRSEHAALLNSDAFDAEDSDMATVKHMLLYPEFNSVNWDTKGGGVIPTLAQAILRLSGFVADAAPIRL